ncbi:hypothetical protein V8C34DRAFT_286192 [Trichoderma compactum]
MAGPGWDGLGWTGPCWALLGSAPYILYMLLDLCWACKSGAWTGTKTPKAYIQCPYD